MSVSPLHARHRTPLHAFYRSPLHAFGPGAEAPPSTWTGGTVTAVQEFPQVPNKARHDCGATAPTTLAGVWDEAARWDFYGLEFDLTHPTPYPAGLMSDLHTRTIRGDTSGAELRIIDYAQDVRCQLAEGSSLEVWWSQGGEDDQQSRFFPDISGYAYALAPVEVQVWSWGTPLPVFQSGESVTVL